MTEDEVLLHSTEQDILQVTKWNGILIKLIWVLFLMLFAFEGLIAVIYCAGGRVSGRFSELEYILDFVVRPCGVVLATVSLANLLLRTALKGLAPHVKSWFIIFTLIIMASEVVAFHYGICVIYVIYVLPIVSSLFFNKRRLLFVTFAGSLLMYFLVLAYIMTFVPSDEYRHNYMDILGSIAILASVYTICSMVLSRVLELIDTAVEETLLRTKLSHEITLDSLTQLYNHASFYRRLDEFIVRCKKDPGFGFSLILLDIDNFKAVNDDFGHAMGDEVIKRLADIIQAKLADGDYAFRYGGEEFAVLVADKTRAPAMAEDIRKEFGMQIYQELPRRVTVSVGVNSYQASYGGKREFFASVDEALYDAKLAGKNIVRFARG